MISSIVKPVSALDALHDQLTHALGVRLAASRLHDGTDDGTGRLHLATADLVGNVRIRRQGLIHGRQQGGVIGDDLQASSSSHGLGITLPGQNPLKDLASQLVSETPGVDQGLLEAAPGIVRGTSNVYLAKKLGITPIGTMAHEFLQAFQALDVQLRNFQKAALESWVHEYRGDLGIALTDVVGMDAFLRDFDLYFAKLFDGLRHDSGDPYE